MLTLAITRKKSADGFILEGSKIIVDPEDGIRNPLFWEYDDDKIHADIIAGDIDWSTAFERACELGCPSYLLPDMNFTAEDSDEIITTMLYPIPLPENVGAMVETLRSFSRQLTENELTPTLANLISLVEIGYSERALEEILDCVSQFCLTLPIPKLIPFGKSESDFWEELRPIYATKDAVPVTW